MNDALLQRFLDLISAYTGLHTREQDREAISKKLLVRLQALKLFTPEEYYQILAFGNNRQSDREWQELIPSLTTGESYFFRDQGQFHLLRQRILPELIASKSQNSLNKPSLRIWSAGCSTGEEVYSLAILVSELIPNLEDWNLLILGTDINAEAIAKAEQGIYTPWSFRMMVPDLQAQYFKLNKDNWQINERIRNLAKFQIGNLLKDPFPSYKSNLHSMDIILCRNVFIYFSADAIATVMSKFCNALNVGGYFINAHAELHGQSHLGELQAKNFPESVVYQRCLNSQFPNTLNFDTQPINNSLNKLTEINSITQSASSSPSQLLQSFTTNKSPHLSVSNSDNIVQVISNNSVNLITELAKKDGDVSSNLSDLNLSFAQLEYLFTNESYKVLIQSAEKFLKTHPKHLGAYDLVARAYANLGEYERANYYCQQAIVINALAIEPYYLLAQMAEEQGDIETAKRFLKKVIYLKPSAIAAYLELNAIYQQEGDLVRARKMGITALNLLRALAPDSKVERHFDLKAGELLLQVQQMLQ